MMLHERFQRHASVAPWATALVHGNDRIGYGELDALADRYACALADRMPAGGIVAICLRQGFDRIALALAAMKAGIAHLPLDPDYPAGRIGAILRDARPALLVRERAAADGIGIDALAGSDGVSGRADDVARPGPDSLCYIAYTSGSSGAPKGVMVTHGNVARLFDDLGPRLALDARDTWLQLHSCAFGFSFWETWGALAHGAPLVLADADQRRDPAALRALVESAGVTVLSLTPTGLRHHLLTGSALPGSLRLVVLSGEPVVAKDLDAFWSYAGDSPPRLVNTYALTETAGQVALREYAPGETGGAGIGAPLADCRFEVRDASGRPLPAGAAGELWIGGPGVAAGYLNDAALTGRRFVRRGGLRWYASGDRARLLADGRAEFLGRADRQVKVRGHRVELADVEAALESHPSLERAVVELVDGAAGDPQLAAWVVPRRAGAQPEFWPSLGGYQVYDELLYDLMGAEASRLARYRDAFERLVPGRAVLDIGTGANALLARMCVEAGARHVYATELLPDAARAARELVDRVGLADRITVIESDVDALELPEPVEVCTQGIIGNIGSADGIVPIWNAARRHFAAGCAAVPARCVTRVAAVTLPDELRTGPRYPALAARYVERIYEQAGRRFDLRLALRNLPSSALLTDAIDFEVLDFSAVLPQGLAGEGALLAKRDGRVDGLLLWTVVETLPGEAVDYLAEQQAWLPVFLPLDFDAPGVEAGARIELAWSREARGSIMPDYLVEVSLPGGRRARHASRHAGREIGASRIHRALAATDEDELPDIAELRAWLATRLPDWMVPARWQVLAQLPQNANGKLDRAALPRPAAAANGGGAASGDPLVDELTVLWADTLGIGAVGADDDFFALGGDSLSAVRLTSRLQSWLDTGVMLTALLERPTVRGLADYLREHHAEALAARAAPVVREQGEL